MRLFGITMVRNEADIIEASVRHNLSLLDGLCLIDHGSVDGTSAILVQLQRENLNLRIVRDPSVGFFQAERMTALARETISRERADFVFVIDADEFVKAKSRDSLERELAMLPSEAHASVQWQTYVPCSFAESAVFGQEHLRRRLKDELHGSHKCIVGRSFAERAQQYLVSGNHLVDDLATPSPPKHILLPANVVAIAHCPVRNRTQLENKIILGYLAHLATRPANDKQALHWRELFIELREGVRLTPERLREIALNYGVPRSEWRPTDRVELLDDPVKLEFSRHYDLDAQAADTLRSLMRFTEALLSHSR
jgi:hypothetical protein